MQIFLMGILPLLIFVIIDSFMSIRAAAIACVVMAILELIWTFYTFGELDLVSGASVFLILILGFATYRSKNSRFIKFQPVVLSAIFGLTLLGFYFAGKPLILLMMEKYSKAMPENLQHVTKQPLFAPLMTLISHYAGYALLAHAALTAWCAVKLNNWWWIFMRGVGFHGFLALSFIVARYQLLNSY